jgi:hypothetical protein
MRVRDGEHVVAAVDRDDRTASAQQASREHATELAETDNDNFTHAGSRKYLSAKDAKMREEPQKQHL